MVPGVANRKVRTTANGARQVCHEIGRYRIGVGFRVFTARPGHTIQGGVSTVGLVAASVSLLVAGLGILNIMSTSVIERTREIGLRKALGGREREILVQFLLEALLISLIGGLIGLALGAFGSVVITHYSKLPLVPSASSILLALSVSVFVGLVAGFYPALRAARMRPVEALRYE